MGLDEWKSAKLMDDAELAELLGMNRNTIKAWRSGGVDRGPRWFYIGRSVRYRESDVLEWIERQYELGPDGLV